jgi:hypothetical protein
MSAVHSAPQQVVTTNPASIAWMRCKDACANLVGWCLEKSKAPALLKEFEYVDAETDETIYLFTDKRYSVFCVGSRRFYFDRLTGKFDGISAPACSVSGRVELRD